MQKITSITKESLIKSFHDTLSDGFSSVGNDALGFNQRFPESEQVIKMYSVAEFKNILELKLSKKRYIHSLNVADEARKLAEHYGYCDTDKAYLAGLLHDNAKRLDNQVERSKELLAETDEIELRNPVLLHAKLGAETVKCFFGICDREIIEAIKWHTVGKKDMSLLEKIVFVADLVEENRTFARAVTTALL